MSQAQARRPTAARAVLRALASMLFLLAGAPACATSVYQPSGGAVFEADAAKEINDEDVRKAFEARPQLSERANIAYYSFDAASGDKLEAALKAWPGTQSVYKIPPLIVTGQRRFDQGSRYSPPAEVSIKKLRLLAARARADLLVVFDYGHRVLPSANGLVAFSPLILPLLFVPFRDVKVESYMEAFVIDTRNGYLYGHLSVDDEGGEDYLTIYSDRADELIQEQRERLATKMRERLVDLLTRESSRAKVAAPAQPAAPAPSAPPPEAPERAPAGPL